jgi:hypothetical protein
MPLPRKLTRLQRGHPVRAFRVGGARQGSG